MSATVSQVRTGLYLLFHPRRLLTLFALVLGGITYVWFAAVRAVPGVREQKAAARARRRERRTRRTGDGAAGDRG